MAAHIKQKLLFPLRLAEAADTNHSRQYNNNNFNFIQRKCFGKITYLANSYP